MMCLAVPGLIIKKRDVEATVDMHGNQVEVNTMLVPEAREGDWVLVHAGFAIQQLDAQDAAETFAVLEDMARKMADEPAGESDDAKSD